jgi:hypothetical protein
MKLANISHYGDILAIPFFAILFLYFYWIPEKSYVEYILMFFSMFGFVLDILYTYMFVYQR